MNDELVLEVRRRSNGELYVPVDVNRVRSMGGFHFDEDLVAITPDGTHLRAAIRRRGEGQLEVLVYAGLDASVRSVRVRRKAKR